MEFFDKNKLFCYGCCHSAVTEKFPGKPSGERPCCFCIRNKKRGLEIDCWYDGSPAVRIPMDCYHSSDMLDQIEIWMKKERR